MTLRQRRRILTFGPTLEVVKDCQLLLVTALEKMVDQCVPSRIEFPETISTKSQGQRVHLTIMYLEFPSGRSAFIFRFDFPWSLYISEIESKLCHSVRDTV
jgi:hypothetical protein